jgi:hypothetical protein
MFHTSKQITRLERSLAGTVGTRATFQKIAEDLREGYKNRKFTRLKGRKRSQTVRSQPTDGQLYTIGCVSESETEFLEFNVDISRVLKLRFLLDTGAEISLIKSPKLIGTTEFDPSQRVRVKCVDGSVVETHGMVKVCISEDE